MELTRAFMQSIKGFRLLERRMYFVVLALISTLASLVAVTAAYASDAFKIIPQVGIELSKSTLPPLATLDVTATNLPELPGTVWELYVSSYQESWGKFAKATIASLNPRASVQIPRVSGQYYLWLVAHSPDGSVVHASFTGFRVTDAVVSPQAAPAVAAPPLVCSSYSSGLPALSTIDSCARLLSETYKVPLPIVRAAISQESDWQPSALSDDCGIGLMQITPYPPPVYSGCTRAIVLASGASLLKDQASIDAVTPSGDNSFSIVAGSAVLDATLLFDDWRYNLEAGVRLILANKGYRVGGFRYDTLDASILENWYYPLQWYNAGIGDNAAPDAWGLYSKTRSDVIDASLFPYAERLFNILSGRTLNTIFTQLALPTFNVVLPGPTSNPLGGSTASGYGVPASRGVFQHFCAGDRVIFKQDNTAQIVVKATRGSVECPDAATESSATVVVPGGVSSSTRTNQSIQWVSTPSAVVMGGTANVSATATSGLAVSFSVPPGNGKCTLSGSTVTGVSVGQCVVYADQAGTFTYSSAQASATFPITAGSATPPSAPSIVSVMSGPLRVTVTFSPPVFTGGAPILGYTATCTAALQTTRTITGTGSPLVIDGLTAGAVYTCSVTAFNGAYSSVASPATAVTVLPVDITPILMLLLD